jgi:hypothetical protein
LEEATSKKEARPNRSWSELLKRSFAIDVLVCFACGGKMRFISHIEEPIVVSRILDHIGLQSEAPRIHPPRGPPQRELFESTPTKHDEFYQPSFDD